MYPVLFCIMALMIFVYIAAGSMAIATYSITKKKIILYLGIFSLACGVEQILILFNDFNAQNIAFDISFFYDMEHPYLRIITGTLILGSLWLFICEFFNRDNINLKRIPIIVFASISLLILLTADMTLPERKWIFYSCRQFFLLFAFGYALFSLLKAQDGPSKIYYTKQIPLVVLAIFMVIAILIEDTFVMLIIEPETFPLQDFLPFLYRRNISELVFMFVISLYTIRVTYRNLTLVRKESVSNPTDQQMEHAKLTVPLFAESYNLTARETDILGLIVDGFDNQQIANELHLALGTIKTHTHNILKKTGAANRQELLKLFWSKR